MTRIKVEISHTNAHDTDIAVYLLATSLTKDVIVLGLSRFVPSECFEVVQVNKGECDERNEREEAVHDRT